MVCSATAVADPITITRYSTVYSNTESTSAVVSFGGGINSVLIDDVLVPSARNPLNRPLQITSVTVLVAGGLVDNDVSLWRYAVEADGSPGFVRDILGTAAVSDDSSFHPVTFGNGSTPLFTVVPNSTAEPGFGLFFLGLSSSRGVGWLWANGPDVNLPTAYLHNLTLNQLRLFTTPGGTFPPHVSFALEVEGSPVPEPGSFALLGVGLLAAASFRHVAGDCALSTTGGTLRSRPRTGCQRSSRSPASGSRPPS